MRILTGWRINPFVSRGITVCNLKPGAQVKIKDVLILPQLNIPHLLRATNVPNVSAMRTTQNSEFILIYFSHCLCLRC